jgi:hypothetical protein
MSKRKRKLSEAEREKLRERALELLRSPDLFGLHADMLRQSGLAGEARNAAVLQIVGIARLLDRPLNVFIKGQSSSGKNYLAKQVLRQFPPDAVREITSSSETAWNYAGDDFRHRIVYLQERNQAAGPVHQARLLISENKLIRTVTVNQGGSRVSKSFVTKGPIAAISTTTKNQLEIDDETRHISIWIDESREQTRAVLLAQASARARVSKKNRYWRKAHSLLAEMAKNNIVLPEWFEELARLVYIDDVRVRRYYPAFISACQAVALLRAFQGQREREIEKTGRIKVNFEDFAIAQILFEPVFSGSLHRGPDASYDVRAHVEKLVRRNKGKAIGARELAKDMRVSLDRAYATLREATESGAIERANKPEKSNLKLFLPAPRQEFIPDPQFIFDRIPAVGDHFRFVHPLTRKWIEFGPRHKK